MEEVCVLKIVELSLKQKEEDGVQMEKTKQKSVNIKVIENLKINGK